LRADLVINNLVGYAVLQERVLMKSDGSPWRPLVHIEDISRAFAAALKAPRELVHNEVLNVCAPGENYQIRQIAEIVEDTVPGSSIQLADEAGPDIRDYRVDAAKIREVLPGFQPSWTVPEGVAEMYKAFSEFGTPESDFLGRLLRIKWLLKGQEAGRITRDLRINE
jgi:nucleoside-diphosphate-sugar epimerase